MDLDRVFPYSVSGKARFADPLRLYRKFIMATGGAPDPLLEAAQLKPGAELTELAEERVKRLEAEQYLADAALETFALPRFNEDTGEGMTDAEALKLLYRWLDWELARDHKNKPEAVTTDGSNKQSA